MQRAVSASFIIIRHAFAGERPERLIVRSRLRFARQLDARFRKPFVLRIEDRSRVEKALRRKIMEITVIYESIDRCRKTRKFKTLKGAQKHAQKWVGLHPEISTTFQYAVSGDGVGKITVDGAAVADLFPDSGLCEFC
jgi:hypothetical protein